VKAVDVSPQRSRVIAVLPGSRCLGLRDLQAVFEPPAIPVALRIDRPRMIRRQVYLTFVTLPSAITVHGPPSVEAAAS